MNNGMRSAGKRLHAEYRKTVRPKRPTRPRRRLKSRESRWTTKQCTKWMGSPAWYHNGLIAVANAHKHKVKLTFSPGVLLPDHHKLFNAGLEGNKWRAIDIYENDRVEEPALKDLSALQLPSTWPAVRKVIRQENRFAIGSLATSAARSASF